MSITISSDPSVVNNFLAGNRATFHITSLPGFEFLCQDFVIPGINMNPVVFPTRFSNVKFGGDKIQYEPLNVTFIVDELMENWIALFNWFVGVGFPESHEQYAQRPIDTSDATVLVFSNHQNPVVTVSFKNLVPVSLGSIDFTTQDQETLIRRATVNFEYDYYTISRYK